MSQITTMNYVFSPECQALLGQIGLSEDQVIDANENRDDVMIVPSVPAHMYSFRWLDDGKLLMVSCQISKVEWQVDRARPTEITVKLALLLRPGLPSGTLHREMHADQIWSRIADSFGTPVTCHEDFPRFLRYTGRADGDAPRFDETGIDGDRYIVDGVLETSGENAKYVWVLSVKKYLDWLPEPFGGIAAPASSAVEGGDVPRLLFARMRPARLTGSVIVRADIGEAAVRLLSTHCSLCDIDDPPYFHPTMKCLHVFAMEILDPENLPSQAPGKEYVVPVHFVTDIRPGPEIQLTGESSPQRSAVLTNDYRAGNRMGLRSIESMLEGLTAR